MDNDAKIRPLYLAKILYEKTDEDNLLSTSQLIKILQDEYGIKSYRTTIASDIELLTNYGFDIQCVKSQSLMYNLVSREFDLPEVKLLIDAVASSKFITEKKSGELISKLETLASKNQAELLKRNLIPKGRIKPDNEYIYYIVDAINDAINAGKKISFQYFTYNVRKEQKPKHNGECYIFSPYHLVWNGDYYYVVGFSDKHNGIGSFRVDRIMSTPKILDENAVAQPKDFDLNRFINVNFRMYNSPTQQVELICDNSVMDTMIDKFGDDLQTYANDMESFRAVVDVAVNHVFYGWIFGFGGKVKIKSPQDVKNDYARMVKEAYENTSK